MWGFTPIQSYTFKGHDHNFVPVLIFYFRCVQCLGNILLANNRNLNVSRRVISNIQFPILCHVNKVPNYCTNRRSGQTGRQTEHYLRHLFKILAWLKSNWNVIEWVIKNTCYFSNILKNIQLLVEDRLNYKLHPVTFKNVINFTQLQLLFSNYPIPVYKLCKKRNASRTLLVINAALDEIIQ